MQTKILGLGAAVPLAAVSLMAISAPAEAIVFKSGDILNITGSYTRDIANDFKFTFNDAPGDMDAGFGNFGVTLSTGDFENFDTNGLIVPQYDILNVDFSNPNTYRFDLNGGLPFLRLSANPVPGSFSFIITSDAQIDAFNPPGPLEGVSASFAGKFVSSEGEALGDGILTGNFRPNGSLGSFSGTFIVAESVPEPSTVMALGAVLGFASLAGRRKKKA
ncbi:PEP-CTERM sorting domain-containing protein [Coleofasciculus sp.]|uniref:PEP-CTERM sorting domain-containing protein n=1 Tax=Coleofasciculus sp. TaxID=3100458 RepID=UPI0039F85F53